MGKFFSINEMAYSDTAKKRGINNTPPAHLISNGVLLIELLDKIRERYGKPIYINSGYRCDELNRAVKGSPTSDHKNFYAADIRADDNKKLWNLIVSMINNKEIVVDQLIDEKNLVWIHISTRRTGNRNQIFAIK